MLPARWRPIGRDLPRFERDFLQDMNRFFSDMRSFWEGEGEFGAWTPFVNVFERDDKVILQAELPGMTKDSIEVSVHDHVVTLTGERKQDEALKEKDFYRHELPTGTFCRSVTLPTTVDADKIDATYADGVLTLTIPKSTKAMAKRIPIH